MASVSLSGGMANGIHTAVVEDNAGLDEAGLARWQALTIWQLIGFTAGLGGLLAMIFLSEPGFVRLIDDANLLFHEAGHPIVGLFSRRLEPYGGTFGQLFFPMALMVKFWRLGQPLSFAGSGLWFFENFLNISRYMADARALALPLVGGGDHDWNTIFSRWSVLMHDVQIAQGVKIAGWTGIVAMCAFVIWQALQNRGRKAQEIGADWPMP